MQKQLQQLVNMLPEFNVIGGADKTITDITADSRVVQKGSLFIALKGAHVDGHTFLSKAAEAGAAAPGVVRPRPALHHTPVGALLGRVHGALQTSEVGFIRGEPVQAPFEYVAFHVVETPVVGRVGTADCRAVCIRAGGNLGV